MPSSIHRFTARTILIVFYSLSICVPSQRLLAQHTAARTTGGVVHVPAPIPHIAISPSPILNGPVSAPRMPIPSYVGITTSAITFRPPRRPIRPFPPVLFIYQFPYLAGPFWGWNSCWSANCDYLWLWTPVSASIYSPGPASYAPQVYESPVVYGEERPDSPQLFLKDGTILSVTDYWLIDDQLHFTMIEQEGGKPVEHVIPFDALDMQTTVDTNTRRGFRFMLRDEPFEQYLRDHPEGPPPVLTPRKD